MFSKLAFFIAAFMAIFVAALPSPRGITNSCNPAQTYCCNSVEDAKSSAAQKQIGLAGILAPVAGNVGLTCNPITVIGLQSASCTSQQACCSGDSFSGAVVLGCSPLNVNA